MKYLKVYENFDEIKNLCKKYFIQNYSVNSDGSVDVDGDVNLSHSELEEIPIKFKRIIGSFFCDQNQLTSLKNSPVYVEDEFHCGYNNLKTLLDGPKGAKRYCCYCNFLTDLYGFPDQVNSFLLFNNSAQDKPILKLSYNPVCEIIKLCKYSPCWSSENFNSDIKIKFIRLLNEYKVIRNGDIVIQDRLEEALHGIGIEKLDKEIEFKDYRLI